MKLEKIYHTTLVSVEERTGGGADYCQMLLDVCEQRGHTHTRNPRGFEATLSVWWLPTERSLRPTDCTLTLEGVQGRHPPPLLSIPNHHFWRVRWKIHLAELTHNQREGERGERKKNLVSSSQSESAMGAALDVWKREGGKITNLSQLYSACLWW